MTDRIDTTPAAGPLGLLQNDLWQKALTLVPQFLVCGALVYSIFFGGAVAIATQYHVCLLLVVAIVASLLRPEQTSFRRPQIILVFFSAISLWLFFTAFQSLFFSQDAVSWFSPATIQLREQFSGTVALSQSQSITLAPSVSRLAWPKYAIAFAFFLMGTCLWQTRESRNTLLGVISISGILLAIWGITSSLSESTYPRSFASIAYANSAAAQLILAIAASIGLLLEVLRPKLRRRQVDRKRSRSEREKYKNDSKKRIRKASTSSTPDADASRSVRTADTQDDAKPTVSFPALVTVLLGLLILLIGLVWTQSHLAWIATLVPIALWAFSMRKFISFKRAMAYGGLTLLIATIAVYASTLILPAATATAYGSMDSRIQFKHWNSAWDQATEFPVFGIGLGAYEQAQLANADPEPKFWFAHAYNQPLEWIVESGFLGGTFLMIAWASVSFLLVKLYRKRMQGSSFLVWFTVAWLAIAGIGIQSFFDFAILTPAVLWTYMLMLGVVVNIRRDEQGSGSGSRSRSKKTDDGLQKTAWEQFVEIASTKVSRPLTWTLVAAILLLLGQRWLQEDILDKAILRSTQLPVSVTPPTQAQVDLAKKKLTTRANAHPINGELWQRLAAWEMAEFRLRLIDLNKKRNIALTWPTSTPQNMFKTYHALPPEKKSTAIENWVFDDQQQQLLESTKEHFARALQCNPLSARTHHQVAILSPLTETDLESHVKFSRDLSPRDPELQRENGAMAQHLGDTDSMIDQWRKCLKYAPQNVRQIVSLASDTLAPQDIADRVMKDLRCDAWIPVVRSSYREEQLKDFQKPFVDAAKRSVRADENLSDGRRHFFIAQLAELEGDKETATHQYKEAVRAAPGDVEFRYQLAVALAADGQFEDAREAITIGRELEPGNERWRHLSDEINELSRGE